MALVKGLVKISIVKVINFVKTEYNFIRSSNVVQLYEFFCNCIKIRSVATIKKNKSFQDVLWLQFPQQGSKS